MGRSTFTILFYIDKNRVKADGTTAIKCRISVDGKKRVTTTGLFTCPDEWNPKNDSRELKAFREKIESEYNTTLKKSGVVSADIIKNSLGGVNSSPEYILVAGENERERLRLRSAEINSTSSYRDSKQTQAVLREFIELRGVKDLQFKEIAHEFGESFKLYLQKEKGYKPNHVNRCMTWLNRLIYTAINQEIIKIHPLEDVKYVKVIKPEHTHITMDELQRIMELPMPTERGEFSRRMFILTAFTGLAYVDLQALYPKEIKRTSKGEHYICISRTKTDVEAFIPLHPIALQIFKLYNLSDESQPIFPQMDRNSTWREVKAFGLAAGVKSTFSYYSARHSFATLMLDAGVPIESVSKMMGHADISSTQVYGKITDEKISNDMDMLMERRKQIAANN
ncbi:MAG: site-specific integrase [Rikenellaceae bacterium]